MVCFFPLSPLKLIEYSNFAICIFLIIWIFAQLLQSHENKLRKKILRFRSTAICLICIQLWIFAFPENKMSLFFTSSRQYLISDAKKLIEYQNWTHNEIIWFNLLINSYKIGLIQVYFWRAFSWPSRNLLQRIWLSSN